MNYREVPVFVTGANRGVGFEFVKLLLERGTPRIYAGVRTTKALEDLAKLGDDRVVPVEVDITNVEQTLNAAREASDVGVLVNNAGVLASGDTLTSDLDAIHEDVQVNYLGTLNMIRAFAPVLERNGGGTIVNILTLIALGNYSAMGGYCASKAAALSMTQNARARLRDKSIEVVNAFPGGIDTDMLAHFDGPKTPPTDVATAVLDGLDDNQEDIFPCPASQTLGPVWLRDPKEVERQIGAW